VGRQDSPWVTRSSDGLARHLPHPAHNVSTNSGGLGKVRVPPIGGCESSPTRKKRIRKRQDRRGHPPLRRDLRRLCRKSRVSLCKSSRTAHCYSITATSLALRVSCPSAWPHAIQAGLAVTGSRRSAPAGSASTPSAITCLRVRANPSRRSGSRALVRKREELARVLERLRSPGLRQGIARELREHVAILEREITELEQVRVQSGSP
jgi:hypothetical protein